MELIVSPARTRGNNVPLRTSSQRGHRASPESHVQKHPEPHSPLSFVSMHMNCQQLYSFATPFKVAVLFFFFLCRGKVVVSAKTTMSLNTGAPTLELAGVVSRCI